MSMLTALSGWVPAVTVAGGVVEAAVLSPAALPDAAAAASTPPAAPAKPPARPAGKTALRDLATRLDLREPFNLGRGKVRIVAFLSPTCAHCVKNAAGLQQLVLDKIDSPDISVHVVWLAVLDTDNRAAAQSATSTLPDPRVNHYWDPKRLHNDQILDAIEFDVQVGIYDIFLLYERTSVWDKRLPRPGWWMHEYRGAPGPIYDPPVFAAEVAKALEGKPLVRPKPY